MAQEIAPTGAFNTIDPERIIESNKLSSDFSPRSILKRKLEILEDSDEGKFINDGDVQDIPVIKLYKRRWCLLLVFVVYAFSTAVQYTQYTVIADVVVDYYNVSYDAVNWSVTIYCVTYCIIFVPGSYIIHKVSMRTSILLGAIGTAIGAWIKVFSVNRDRYWLALLGQGIGASFQLFVIPFAPKLAAAWFGENEVSTACSIGYVGLLLGFSFGYLIPTLAVSKDNVEQGLFGNVLGVALAATIVIPLILFLFKNDPPTPPSIAQWKSIKNAENEVRYFKSIKKLVTNKAYILNVIIFGINISIFTPLMVMLNQLTLLYYPDASVHVGMIGLVASFMNILSTFTAGIILDKFRKFKETLWTVHVLIIVTTIMYIATLDQGLHVVYITFTLASMTTGLLMVVAIEASVELTYPEPEAIVGGLMITAGQLISIPLMLLYSALYKNSLVWANTFLVLIALAADLLFLFMKFETRRQDSQKLTPQLNE